jgi:hypothetical protein
LPNAISRVPRKWHRHRRSGDQPARLGNTLSWRARGAHAPFIAEGFQCDSGKTGSINREDELIVLRLLVPTLACRNRSIAGVSGFWSSLVMNN